jgi:putrescine importer
MTGILWSFLHKDALIAGGIWAAVGIVYAVVLSKVTGRKVADVVIEENAAPVAVAPERELVPA